MTEISQTEELNHITLKTTLRSHNFLEWVYPDRIFGFNISIVILFLRAYPITALHKLETTYSSYSGVSTKTWNDLKPPTTTSKISTTTYNHLKNIYSLSQTI